MDESPTLQHAVDPARLRYLTDEQPGIGGRLKCRPEDFRVEEVPLFEPTGEGPHLYLLVEKRRRLTTDITRILSQHFGISRQQIGFAGLKDKHAITCQAITIENADPDRAAAFDDQYIRILHVDRHRHKLQRGDLAGNRFVIKVREVDAAKVIHARHIMDRLEREGVPNFYGEQRFGYRLENHELGRLLLQDRWQEFLDMMLGGPREADSPPSRAARQAYERGDYVEALNTWPTVHRFERQAIGPLSRGAPPADAVHGIDATQRFLLVSAFQSAVFNRLVDQRLRDGLFGTMLDGDVAFFHETRDFEPVTDAPAMQRRYDAGEVSPTGPVWGRRMRRAKGDVEQWERQALHESGLDESHFYGGEYQPDGNRRALRMLLQDVRTSAGADEHGPYIQVQFMLPRGCFATTVMRELMKA